MQGYFGCFQWVETDNYKLSWGHMTQMGQKCKTEKHMQHQKIILDYCVQQKLNEPLIHFFDLIAVPSVNKQNTTFNNALHVILSV